MFKHAQISWIFLFLRGVGIFDFVFLSHFLTKQWCFWAHLKGNYLQSWKNTLLLTLFHFFKPQRALKWKSYFLRRNFAEAWKGLLDSWQAYFTKWTTSGSPPVGLQGHQDSKSSHSWVILYVTNWSSPCRCPNPNPTPLRDPYSIKGTYFCVSQVRAWPYRLQVYRVTIS